MEHNRGGDQPSNVLAEFALPHEVCGDFAVNYLRPLYDELIRRQKGGAEVLPLNFVPIVIKDDGNYSETVVFGAHFGSDDKDTPDEQSGTGHRVFDVTLVTTEWLNTNDITPNERAIFRVLINKRARYFESRGELSYALVLRKQCARLSSDGLAIGIGTANTYSFSPLNGSSRKTNMSIYIDDQIKLISDNEITSKAVERGSEEWMLDAQISAVSLSELYKLVDKMVEAGMMAPHAGQELRARYAVNKPA